VIISLRAIFERYWSEFPRRYFLHPRVRIERTRRLTSTALHSLATVRAHRVEQKEVIKPVFSQRHRRFSRRCRETVQSRLLYKAPAATR